MSRRPNWQYPPPQTPKILNFPRRRPRRVPAKTLPGKPICREDDSKGKLEALFDQERVFAKTSVPIVVLDCDGRNQRGRVEVEECGDEGGGLVVEDERWRFQAEMLRAECKLLRMEREIAVKKMERRRVHVERILGSAIQTLINGRRKIHEGSNSSMVLEQEIQDLVEKLEKLQWCTVSRQYEVRKCGNFDKHACVLQRRIDSYQGAPNQNCLKGVQEATELNLLIDNNCRVDKNAGLDGKFQVDILSNKMAGLSNAILLEKMKKYGPMLSTRKVSSMACSTSTLGQNEICHPLALSQDPDQEEISHVKDICSGHCKAIVQRLVGQIRAETEQWSQMQEMLGQIREELEELQASRDFWEDQALDCDNQIQSLHSAVQEWRQKALSSENKRNELHAQLKRVNGERERAMKEKNAEAINGKFAVQNETEKRVLICDLKKNVDSKEGDRIVKTKRCSSGVAVPKRSPFQDIGNSFQRLRQEDRANLSLHTASMEKSL